METNLILAIVSFISLVAVTRYMVGEIKKHVEAMLIRLDKHGDDLVTLNTKSELAVTAKDVDDKFVSKELFKQFEKHIDQRFDNLEGGQDKILDFIEKRKP